jgi:hypothetical protein
MFTEPTNTEPINIDPKDDAGGTEKVSAEAGTAPTAPSVIFEDGTRPIPIRDPKSASLIFKPSGQGCFP